MALTYLVKLLIILQASIILLRFYTASRLVGAFITRQLGRFVDCRRFLAGLLNSSGLRDRSVLFFSADILGHF